jgi:hypothetical protein
MSNDPRFQVFTEQVLKEFPELRQVLDQAKNGSLSEADAMRCLNEIVVSNPDIARRLQEMARNTLVPEEHRAKPLDHGGLVFHKDRGLPRLNPLVEAALIERAQFDGDIPELRTGAMLPGVVPAVSVDTRVRNPVALGLMLQDASEQVAAQIQAAEPERLRLLAQATEGVDDETLALVAQAGQALTKTEAQEQILDGKTAALDVPSYRRGQVPAPLTVTQPSGSALLAMTPQERKQGAWKFLSTTQGRRTALAGLAELVATKLQGEGFEVQARHFVPGAVEPVLAAHEWTVGIDGPGATQPAFSLIDIAAICIAKGLTKQVGDRRGRVILEVTAINTVDIRSVGWAGRLLGVEAALGGVPC